MHSYLEVLTKAHVGQQRRDVGDSPGIAEHSRLRRLLLLLLLALGLEASIEPIGCGGRRSCVDNRRLLATANRLQFSICHGVVLRSPRPRAQRTISTARRPSEGCATRTYILLHLLIAVLLRVEVFDL